MDEAGREGGREGCEEGREEVAGRRGKGPLPVTSSPYFTRSRSPVHHYFYNGSIPLLSFIIKHREVGHAH